MIICMAIKVRLLKSQDNFTDCVWRLKTNTNCESLRHSKRAQKLKRILLKRRKTDSEKSKSKRKKEKKNIRHTISAYAVRCACLAAAWKWKEKHFDNGIMKNQFTFIMETNKWSWCVLKLPITFVSASWARATGIYMHAIDPCTQQLHYNNRNCDALIFNNFFLSRCVIGASVFFVSLKSNKCVCIDWMQWGVAIHVKTSSRRCNDITKRYFTAIDFASFLAAKILRRLTAFGFVILKFINLMKST